MAVCRILSSAARSRDLFLFVSPVLCDLLLRAYVSRASSLRFLLVGALAFRARRLFVGARFRRQVPIVSGDLWVGDGRRIVAGIGEER